MSEIQRRYVPRGNAAPKLQERADGALPLITGYASVFYRDGDPSTEYEMWPAMHGYPRVVERIMPTAFAKAIKEDDVRGLFNHDSAAVLGRNGAGTLLLTVDERGLRYEIDPPDTQLARDLIQSIRRGDITGSSFAFVPRDTSYRDVQATPDGSAPACTYIERNDVQLFDVGPVTYPAYTGATSGVRGAGDLAGVRGEIEGREARKAADRDALELMLAVIACEGAEE